MKKEPTGIMNIKIQRMPLYFHPAKCGMLSRAILTRICITNLSKNGTLPILTCELGLLVSKFVLNHFFSSVEQNGVQIVLFERLAHFKLFKI